MISWWLSQERNVELQQWCISVDIVLVFYIYIRVAWGNTDYIKHKPYTLRCLLWLTFNPCKKWMQRRRLPTKGAIPEDDDEPSAFPERQALQHLQTSLAPSQSPEDMQFQEVRQLFFLLLLSLNTDLKWKAGFSILIFRNPHCKE